MQKPKVVPELKEEQLPHFNQVVRLHANKPVWWCILRAINNFRTFCGERGQCAKHDEDK